MPSRTLRRLLGGMTVIGAALLGACGGGDSPTDPGPGPGPDPLPDPSPVIQGRALFGLTCSNNLVEFGSGNPGTLALRRDHRHDGRRLDGRHRLPSIRRPSLRRRNRQPGSTRSTPSAVPRARWATPSRPG
jgi:hypothetical protein